MVEINLTRLKATQIYWNEAPDRVISRHADNSTVIITDQRIFNIYRSLLEPYDPIIFVPESEAAKTWETIVEVAERLTQDSYGRDVFLVGFGGGSVSDFTGFLASIYKRGVRFGLIPTTLLAQVDASLGGKNGINLKNYKNMLGCFKNPDFLLINADLSFTQEPSQWIDGFAEIIKHALIGDLDFLNWLEDNRESLLSKNPDMIQECVRRAAEIKLHIVEEDPFDHGVRKKLNFGHTLAHAIEKELKISHGKAVAIGMKYESQWSRRQGFLSAEETARIDRLLSDFKLLDHDKDISPNQWIPMMLRDKKAGREYIDVLMLHSLGKSEIHRFSHQEFVSLVESCADE